MFKSETEENINNDEVLSDDLDDTSTSKDKKSDDKNLIFYL